MKPRAEWITVVEVYDIRLRHEAGETLEQLLKAHPRLERRSILEARSGRLRGIGRIYETPGCMTEKDVAAWESFGVGRPPLHDEHSGECRCRSGPCGDCPEVYALEVRSRPVELRDFPDQRCDGHPGDDGEDHDPPEVSANMDRLRAGRRTQVLQSEARVAAALVLWQRGLSTKDIAAKMELGISTVQAYLQHHDRDAGIVGQRGQKRVRAA